jgi:hypothetical protein
MGGYGGYGLQNDFMQQIIQDLDNLLESINKIEPNIYGDKLFLESATTSKQKLNDFIDQKLDSNLTLLIELSGINEKVSTEDEFIKAKHELFVFGKKIKELLLKSKDILDFNKRLQFQEYNEELEKQKIELDSKINELNTLLENAKKANTMLDEKSKEAFTKILLDKEAFDYKYAERQYEILSKYWLGGSIVITLILITIVSIKSTNVSGLIDVRKDLCCLAIQDKTMLYIAYGKYISSYILIYSILIFALKVSIKNYNANKHNEIVNRNKKLILSNTINLSREGNNPELLDIAAKELFSQQSTGYNNTTEEKSSSNFVNNIVETVSKKV